MHAGNEYLVFHYVCKLAISLRHGCPASRQSAVITDKRDLRGAFGLAFFIYQTGNSLLNPKHDFPCAVQFGRLDRCEMGALYACLLKLLHEAVEMGEKHRIKGCSANVGLMLVECFMHWHSF